jgi:enoyl-CoA hydratase/carnithine racemase
MRCDFAGDRVELFASESYREIRLARPERHNAVDVAMRDELIMVLRALRTDDAIERIGLVGCGLSFCSGGELSEFAGEVPVANFSARMSRNLPILIASISERLVVGVHGACIGAGVEIMAFAGAVIAAEDARFRLPELRMGLLPGMGGTVSIPSRIGRGRTLRWLLAGNDLDAPTAHAWGPVDEVVPHGEMLARVRGAAAATWSADPREVVT